MLKMNEGRNAMSASDFLLSMAIGAGTALVGIHLYEQFGGSSESREEMSLKEMMVRKEQLEDMIAEYMANLQSNDKSAQMGK